MEVVRVESGAPAGEQLIEQGQGSEAIPGVPARIGQTGFALRQPQALLEGERAGGKVTNFELLDEGPRAQAPFP